MEDAATAEISRAQIWMWIRHGIKLANTNSPYSCATCSLISESLRYQLALFYRNVVVTADLYKKLREEEAKQVNADPTAIAIIDDLILRDDFVDFLTLPAYDHIVIQRSNL